MKSPLTFLLLFLVVSICDAQSIDSNPQPTDIKWETGKGILNLVAWNVESGGNSPQIIAKQLQDFSGCDIVALNECGRKNVPFYNTALGANYQAFISQTGGADHLVILFDTERFELLEQKEMASYRQHLLNNGTHRSPIYVRLKERKTKLEFIFMTNHLARRDESLRRRQAAGLREWARDISTPIIAMGDFNFDYNFRKRKGNESFSEFMKDNVWQWVTPDPLIDTNWSGRVKDSYPDSMLDFVFVANGFKKIKSKSSIIVREGDFPDSHLTSDHRATMAEIRYVPAPVKAKRSKAGIVGFEQGVVSYRKSDGDITKKKFSDLTLAKRKLVMEATGWGRIWEDDKGNHHVIADLVNVNDKSAVLEKADGEQVTVPFARLSKTDRDYAVARKSLAGALPESFSAKVVRVVDGDTLTVLLNRKQYNIRVAGIDAPEKGQAFSQKAKKHLSGLVFGKHVSGVRRSMDSYGRNVCTLTIEGNSVEKEMLREGLAWHYQKFSNAANLQQLEDDAKAENLNIWSEAGPVAPWDWRRWGEAKRKQWLTAKSAVVAPAIIPPNGASNKPIAAVKDRWLNTKSGSRHNENCRWYQNTSSGRMCDGSEGHACGQCGG